MHNDFKWNYMVFPRDSTIVLVFHAKFPSILEDTNQKDNLPCWLIPSEAPITVMVDPNHRCGFAASFLHYTLMSHLIPWDVNVNYYLFLMVEFRI